MGDCQQKGRLYSVGKLHATHVEIIRLLDPTSVCDVINTGFTDNQPAINHSVSPHLPLLGSGGADRGACIGASGCT